MPSTRTSASIVRVVTSNETAPSIETQANEMFEQRADRSRVAGRRPADHPESSSWQQARIEVGYTLEGALTDLHMGRIARDQLAPYVSYGVAGMAVMDVLHYLRDHVYLSAALGRLSLPEDFARRQAYLEYEHFVSGGAGARTPVERADGRGSEGHRARRAAGALCAVQRMSRNPSRLSARDR